MFVFVTIGRISLWWYRMMIARVFFAVFVLFVDIFFFFCVSTFTNSIVFDKYTAFYNYFGLSFNFSHCFLGNWIFFCFDFVIFEIFGNVIWLLLPQLMTNNNCSSERFLTFSSRRRCCSLRGSCEFFWRHS